VILFCWIFGHDWHLDSVEQIRMVGGIVPVTWREHKCSRCSRTRTELKVDGGWGRGKGERVKIPRYDDWRGR